MADRATSDQRSRIYFVPAFFPDGKQVAFTSEYDGNREVYAMRGRRRRQNALRSRPRSAATMSRIDGPNNIVMAWRTRKPLIVFRSRMNRSTFHRLAFHRRPRRELPQQVPVPAAGSLRFHRTIRKWRSTAFSRVRTWKHYRGEWPTTFGSTIFKTGATENLTNNPAQDICPMWDRTTRSISFLDRDGRMNLFVVDLHSKSRNSSPTSKISTSNFRRSGKNRSFFEQAGYIWRYD